MNDLRRHAVEATILVALAAFASFGLPTFPKSIPADAPSDDLHAKAAPVAAALAGANDADRRMWAAVWEGAARVVEAEPTSTEPFITNTKELRAFTVAALNVAWQRIGGVRPDAYPALRGAVERFLADHDVLGRDETTFDAGYAARYAAAARALAAAGRR